MIWTSLIAFGTFFTQVARCTNPTLGYFDNDDQKAKARQAIADAYLLALTAINTPNPAVFVHYFPVVFHPSASSVFSHIVDPNSAQPVGQPIMDGVRIEGAGSDDNRCTTDPKPVAYLTQLGGGAGAVIHLCDTFFKFPSLRGPDAIDVDFVGKTVSWKMTTAGSILLHEFTHWDRIGPPAINRHIDDHGEPGYGCFNVRTLVDADKEVNADNYAWLANENYWTFVAGRTFRDPTAADAKDPRCKDELCKIQ